MRARSQERRYTNARDRALKQATTTSGSGYLKLPQGATLFKPKAGVHYLDILPYEAGKGNPYADPGTLHWERTFYVHRGVGPNQEMVICPRMTRKARCPICEHRMKLIQEANEENEELIRDLSPKQRQLFNVIDTKEPDKGVQILDISYHLFGKLLDARIRNSDEDEGWDRFFHLEDGFTLRVGFAEKSFGGFAYYEAESIDFKLRKEPYDEEILQKVYCLDDLLIELPYEQIRAMFLQIDEPKEENTPEAAKPTESKSKITVSSSEEEEEEEWEEEAPRPSKKLVQAADEEEEEWEEEVPKKPASRQQVEEEEEWEEEPAPKPVQKSPPPSKKQAGEVEEEWEEDWEEEEEPVAKKPTKKVEAEEEDEEEFEEEEEPPAKSKKVRFFDEEEDEEEKPRVKAGPMPPKAAPKSKKVKEEEEWDDWDEEEEA
jgi:hypothetical protein